MKRRTPKDSAPFIYKKFVLVLKYAVVKAKSE